MSDTKTPDREFARVDVDVAARFRIVSIDDAEAVRAQLEHAPSVWTVEGEAELRRLASLSRTDPEVVLARAMLCTVHQVRRLSQSLLDDGGPMEACTLRQVSGGGCQLQASAILDLGALLDVRLLGGDDGAPPIRFLGKILHARGGPEARYGLVFEAIHPTDRDGLIRYLYTVQRKKLRDSTERDE